MNKWSRVVIGLKSAGLFAGTIGFGSLLIKPSSPPLVFADSVKPPPSLSYSIVDDVGAELRQDSRHASRKLLEEFSRNVLEELARNVVEKLSRDVVVLTCESTAEGGSCDVYLVGTFHDSEESCKQVQTIIQSLKPEVVFLEASPSWLTAESVKKAEDEGVPRSEFRVAFEEARSYGAKVVLGDRPVRVTLGRLLAEFPKLPEQNLKFYKMKDMDGLDNTLLIQELRKKLPTLMEIILDERDEYMSSTLLKVAREHSSVVAVVGKSHLLGIKKHWKQPIEALRLKEILEVPSEEAERVMMKLKEMMGPSQKAERTMMMLKKMMRS